MKFFISILLLTTVVVTAGCGPKRVSVDVMKYEVSFDRYEKEKLPLSCMLVLSEDLKQQMPLREEDINLWPWFFTEGFTNICEHVAVVDSLPAVRHLSRADVIVLPSLRDWSLEELPQREMDAKLWHCRLAVDFQVHDGQGRQKSAFVIDKDGWGRNRLRALADVMNRFVSALRKHLKDSATLFPRG